MRVVKIGDRYLNVDQVTEYIVDDTVVIVHFGPDHETRFARHDAVVLRRWLERMAVDLADDEQPRSSPPRRTMPGNRTQSPTGLLDDIVPKRHVR